MDQRAHQRAGHLGYHLLRYVLLIACAWRSCLSKHRLLLLRHAPPAHSFLPRIYALLKHQRSNLAIQTKPFHRKAHESHEAITINGQTQMEKTDGSTLCCSAETSIWTEWAVTDSRYRRRLVNDGVWRYVQRNHHYRTSKIDCEHRRTQYSKIVGSITRGGVKGTNTSSFLKLTAIRSQAGYTWY